MARLVRRTVAVLNALSGAAATLDDLHHATGLHRTTLLRILEVLVDEGLVRRASGDGKYRIRRKLCDWGKGFSFSDHIAEVADDLLAGHAEQVKWPTDVLVLHRQLPCLVVLETNRPQSPFPVKPNQVGHSVPMLPSAAGRTYLAFLDDPRRKALLDRIIGRGRGPYGHQIKREELEADLAEIRRRGFGTRARHFRGGDFIEERVERDGLHALAIPVFRQSQVAAVVNVQWRATAMNEAEFAERYLAQQMDLAAQIGSRIRVT